MSLLQLASCPISNESFYRGGRQPDTQPKKKINTALHGSDPHTGRPVAAVQRQYMCVCVCVNREICGRVCLAGRMYVFIDIHL